VECGRPCYRLSVTVTSAFQKMFTHDAVKDILDSISVSKVLDMRL